MKKLKLLVSFIFVPSVILTSAHATPFNGYIVKVKKGSNFLSQKSVSSLGQITNVRETSFGTFGRLITKKDLTDKAFLGLLQNPEVLYIEPNYIISLSKFDKFDKISKLTAETVEAPVDAKFNKQWGLNNDGKNGSIFSSGVVGEDINALRAWSITAGSKKVKIAVIDTGVDYTHPDLASQIDVNLAELNGEPGVDDDRNGFVDDIYGYNFVSKNGDPMDDGGHGSHCAGVIGAVHNDIGVAGVMANVSILPIKFLNSEGSGEIIDAVASIDYGIKRGVNIMSNSWGDSETSEALEDAIRAANSAGITFVAAAGNDSADNDRTDSYPANTQVENVISVGSYASSGDSSSFSNYGLKSVHVTAPGTNIISTYKDGDYKKSSGTSMATPHIAGIIGLLLSKEPNLTPKEIKERLITTSVKTSALESASVSGGRVDAYRALINEQ